VSAALVSLVHHDKEAAAGFVDGRCEVSIGNRGLLRQQLRLWRITRGLFAKISGQPPGLLGIERRLIFYR